MPNWCENWVTFRGSKEHIGKLKSRVVNPVKVMQEGWLAILSFDQPPWEYGEEFKSDIPPGFSIMARTLQGIDKKSVDYNWMVDNLGTKWDFDIGNLDPLSDTSIGGYFTTAWSPPEGWFLRVCDQYMVTGELSYGEGGNDFAGILEVTPTSEIRYLSGYHEWAQLTDESLECYLEKITSEEDEYPEYVKAMNEASLGWPKDWASYKEKFIESTTQK